MLISGIWIFWTVHYSCRLVDLANRHPYKPLVYYQTDICTYKRMNEYAHKIGRILYEDGSKNRYCVGGFGLVACSLFGLIWSLFPWFPFQIQAIYVETKTKIDVIALLDRKQLFCSLKVHKMWIRRVWFVTCFQAYGAYEMMTPQSY